MFLTNNEYEETMNYKIIRTHCPECKSNKILYDNFHDETFCNHCGLILKDNTLTLITTIIQEDKEKEKGIRRLHYKKRKIKLTE